MNFSHIIVFCTVPDSETAENISEIVVKKRIAACANIVDGIKSVYFWKDSLQKDSELLLILKTRQDLFEELESAIKENHPYDVPEIIAIPLINGNKDYLKWIDANVEKK